MQHSTPSKMKQPDIKTQDRPKNQKQNTTPLEREHADPEGTGTAKACITRNISTATSKKCLGEELPFLNWHLTLSKCFTSTDQHLRNTKMILAEAFLTQISKYSAHIVPKFTWQSFYFVYFCLAKHLSNTAGTYLTQGRIYSSRPDRYFIFVTPVINRCLRQHAYKRDRFTQLKLKPSVTPELKKKCFKEQACLVFMKNGPNLFLKLFNKSLTHVGVRAEEKKFTQGPRGNRYNLFCGGICTLNS